MRERIRVLPTDPGRTDPDFRHFEQSQKFWMFSDVTPEEIVGPLLQGQFNAPRSWAYYTPTVTYGRERILDVTARHYIKTDKPVTHTKYQCVSLPFARSEIDLTYWRAPYWKQGFSGVWHARFAPATSLAFAEIEALDYFADMEKLLTNNTRAEAYWTMRPYMEAKSSMVNFLFELKDFRDIAKYFFKGSVLKDLRKLERKLSSADADKWKKTKVGDVLDGALDGAATSRLVYSFALKPTLSDIKDIMESLATTVEAAQKLMAENAAGTERHFSKLLHTSGTFGSPTTLANLKFLEGTLMSTKYTATMNFGYKFNALGRVKAFAQYWGLQWDSEKIWNALPLSFLLDYVFSIANALHVMRMDPQVTDLTTHSYVESIKGSMSAGKHVYSDVVLNGNWFNGGFIVDGSYYYRRTNAASPIFVNGTRAQYYRRWCSTPYCGPHLPVFHGMKSGHMLNTAALLKVLL